MELFLFAVNIIVVVFFMVMASRLVKGVEKIVEVLERRAESGPNRWQV